MQIEQLQALNANKKMLLDESKRALDDYRSLTGEKGRSMTFEEGRMALALILDCKFISIKMIRIQSILLPCFLEKATKP